MKSAEVYWNEDGTEYAVLVSRGYGAGFSTWSKNAKVACDKRVINWFLAHDRDYFEQISFLITGDTLRAETEKFFHSLGYDDVCLLGLADCMIVWVPCDVVWRIKEYDGAETIEYRDKQNWMFIDDE